MSSSVIKSVTHTHPLSLSVLASLPGGGFDQRTGAAAHLLANVDVPSSSRLSACYPNKGGGVVTHQMITLFHNLIE